MKKGLRFGWFVVVLAALTIAIITIHYLPLELKQLQQVDKLKACPSEIYLRMLVHYDKAPVYEEEYRMQDINGASKASYRIRTYAGKEVTVSEPARSETDVSFLLGSTVQDGIWDLTNRPPEGNTAVHYTVYVKQLVDCKQGVRTITFTDPKHIATDAGREYQIDLSKQKVKSPADLIHLESKSLADPHYLAVVTDFRTFGSETFRKNVAEAQAAARASK